MRRIEDMTGKRCGKLRVRSQEVLDYKGKKQSICHCICDCGNKCDVLASRIKYGMTKSCGCTRERWFLEGKKFGRLTAVKIAKKRKGVAVAWKCRCDCGNEIDVTVEDLLAGKVTSCGCVERELNERIQSQQSFVANLWGSLMEICNDMVNE